MTFGTGFLIPRTTISSRVAAGSLGTGLPADQRRRHDGRNNGSLPRPGDRPGLQPQGLTPGLRPGHFRDRRLRGELPGRREQPDLNPQVPFGRGVGPLYTQLQLIQFTPTVAIKLDDQWSIGASSTLTWAPPF